jgi:hypothetical protein
MTTKQECAGPSFDDSYATNAIISCLPSGAIAMATKRGCATTRS